MNRRLVRGGIIFLGFLCVGALGISLYDIFYPPPRTPAEWMKAFGSSLPTQASDVSLQTSGCCVLVTFVLPQEAIAAMVSHPINGYSGWRHQGMKTGRAFFDWNIETGEDVWINRKSRHKGSEEWVILIQAKTRRVFAHLFTT